MRYGGKESDKAFLMQSGYRGGSFSHIVGERGFAGRGKEKDTKSCVQSVVSFS